MPFLHCDCNNCGLNPTLILQITHGFEKQKTNIMQQLNVYGLAELVIAILSGAENGLEDAHQMILID
jgi:hypothetical protein